MPLRITLDRLLFYFLITLVEGQFFVQSSDHFSNAGLRKALLRYRVILLKPLQPSL